MSLHPGNSSLQCCNLDLSFDVLCMTFLALEIGKFLILCGLVVRFAVSECQRATIGKAVGSNTWAKKERHCNQWVKMHHSMEMPWVSK